MSSKEEEEEEEGNDTHTALIKTDQENKKRCTPRRSSRAPKPVEYNDFGEVVEEDDEGVPGSDDDNDSPDGNHLSLISFQQCTCIFNCGVYDVLQFISIIYNSTVLCMVWFVWVVLLGAAVRSYFTQRLHEFLRSYGVEEDVIASWRTKVRK
jgi:hypothetical protein